MYVYVNEDYEHCSTTPEGCARIVKTETAYFADRVASITDVRSIVCGGGKAVAVYVDGVYKSGEPYVGVITWARKEIVE